MSHLLHHCGQLERVIRECHRILAPNGILLNRYGAIEDILDDPEHRFFPEVTEFDKLRTPAKHQIESWFKETGFTEIYSDTLTQQTFPCVEQRVKAIQGRHISALWLISDSAFNTGLTRLQNYIAFNPQDSALLVDRITFTFGKKCSHNIKRAL